MRMHATFRALLAAGGSLAAIGVATVAMAQDAPAALASGVTATADTPAQSSDTQSDPEATHARTDTNDIVVTARRRSESIQIVPVAITAVTGQTLERQSVSRITELARFAPGLIATETTGASGGAIFLRGIGSSSSQGLIDQSVAVNIDGVQVSNGAILRATGVDISRVEVLRGPQALFFGKNSPGGVISYRSADPGKRFEMIARSSYDTDARELAFEGTVSGPLAANLGARITGRFAKSDGYLHIRSVDAVTAGGTAIATSEDRYPRSEDAFLRATLLWSPSDAIQSRAKLTYTNRSVDGGLALYTQKLACPLGVPQQGGVAAPPALQIDDCTPNGTTVAGNIPVSILTQDPSFGTNPLGFLKNRQWLGSLETNVALSEHFDLNLITGYYDLSENGAGSYSIYPIANVVIANPSSIRQISQEVRLASDPDRPINFMLDGYYENTRRTIYTRAYFGTRLLQGEYFRTKGEVFSGFAQAEARLFDGVKLSGGARFTRETRSISAELNGVAITNIADRKIAYNNLSPEATISWRPNSNTMVYGSYRRGFKSGGFDAGYGTAARLGANRALRFDYNPEKVNGFEGGIRATLAGGALRGSLTAYNYDYSDLQLTSFDAVALAIVTRNAATATVRGLEGDLSWNPRGIPGLTVRAVGAYNRARYGNFIAGCYGGQTISLGCNLNLNAAGAFTSQNLSGAPLLLAPELSGSLGIYYETDIGGLRLGLSSDTSFTSSYYAQVEEPRGSFQSAAGKIDLSARLFRPDSAWELKIIGRNLTNRYTITRSVDTSLTGSGTGRAGPAVLADPSGSVSRGRQIILEATFKM